MRKIYLLLPFLAACTPNGSESVLENEQLSTSYTGETVADDSMGQKTKLITYRLVEEQPGSPMPTFHAASYQGTLTTQGQCVGLKSGDKFMPLAFVEGTAIWNDDHKTLTVDGKTFNLDDSIGVGGSSSGGPIVDSIVNAVPSSCSDEGMWFVATKSTELKQ